jgi:UDP-N-acetylmuramate: L-alanyl-gamma-D-glutamyl-meso-diaminopimelate ligase
VRAHIIGICGTAMAGIASMLKDQGLDVQGSDAAAYPPMSTLLADRGIEILHGYDARNLANRPDFVVVGNVARRDNPEVLAATAQGIPLKSMPEIINQRFLRTRTSVTVAGTHGKTTTTSLLAWLLGYAGEDPSYLVGGIPVNYGSNYRLGAGRHFVIEGDEYDTAFFDKEAKFFHYDPTFAVVTSLEFDHADIYPDFPTLQRTFERFVALVPPEGSIAYCADYPVLEEVMTHSRAGRISYGFAPGADIRIDEIDAGPAGTRFVICESGRDRRHLHIRMWGAHNVLNATAAYAVAREVGLPASVVAEGLATFKGVVRRFQTVLTQGGVTVIDDFAHHPTAVSGTIAAVRMRFPEARVFALYHFASNTSRRRLFEDDYAQAFKGADEVFLTHPLQKADGLRPEEYLDPAVVVEGIRQYAGFAGAYSDFEEMARAMAEKLRPSDVVVAMSGKDLTPFYRQLEWELKKRNPSATEPSTASGR